MTILLILSVVIIIAVMMQPAKTDNAMSSLTGEAGDLFSKQKSRGFEAFMQRVTAVLLFLFFAITIAMVYVSAH